MRYPMHGARMSDLVWAAVCQRAQLEGTTASRIIVAACCEYVSKPLPATPERRTRKRVAAPPGRPLDALGGQCGQHGSRQAKGVCLACGEPAEGSA